jgi:hypothetical protein
MLVAIFIFSREMTLPVGVTGKTQMKNSSTTDMVVLHF